MLHHRKAAVAVVLAASSGSSLAQTFRVLPPLFEGGGARANGVSRSGEHIAGVAADPKTGMTTATTWHTGSSFAWPHDQYGTLDAGYAIDNFGEVIAGESDGQAVVWFGNGYALDALLGPGAALDISPDGAVSVGYLTNAVGGTVGFRRQRLGTPHRRLAAPGDDFSEVNAIASATGPCAGSSSRFENDVFFSRACVWDLPGAPLLILPDPQGHTISGAQDLTPSGDVVVGFSAPGAETPARAVRWAGGVPSFLSSDAFSNAHAVSGDGNTVVGEGFDGAFVWRPGSGMRSLTQVLASLGADTAGSTLVAALDVSDDGRSVVGWGFDVESGAEIGWYATLPALCASDFNLDGAANSQDFFDFLAAFFLQDETADFNRDSVVNSQDFFDFLSAFFTGCA